MIARHPVDSYVTCPHQDWAAWAKKWHTLNPECCQPWLHISQGSRKKAVCAVALLKTQACAWKVP